MQGDGNPSPCANSLMEACILCGEGLEPETKREIFGAAEPELKPLTVWLSKAGDYAKDPK